jgi:hypothetical protein
MARPRLIKDDESKDVHAIVGKRMWERLSLKAHRERTSISALVRKALEVEYGTEEGRV